MGRKYGRLAYGRYTYDLWPPIWQPVPEYPPVEIWVPDPGTSFPPTEVWNAIVPNLIEIWEPIVPSTEVWSPTVFNPTEIWTPVTEPILGLQNG